MKYFYPFILIILFFSFSCNRTKNAQEISENSDSIKISSNRIVNTIGETLTPVAKKAVSEWKEYQEVDDFIIKFYNISNGEALDYAEDLSGLIKAMKDTVRVEKLKELNITARFNVLHNEVLRLADMATIPSITEEEVKEEVSKILELYSAVNSKINTIYKAEELQKALEVDTETPIEIKKNRPYDLSESERDRFNKSNKPKRKKKSISSKKTNL